MKNTCLLSTTCLLFMVSACERDQSDEKYLTEFEKQQFEIEAMEKEGCLYQNTLYSSGAPKQSMKAIVNSDGQMEMVVDPDGIWMTCRKANQGYAWVIDPSLNDMENLPF